MRSGPFSGARAGGPRLHLPAALLTLGGFAITFAGLWLLVTRLPRLDAESEPALAVVRLLLVCPVVVATVWLSSVARNLPTALVVALCTVTGAVADWMFFEALSDFYGELLSNDVIETGFNALLTVGLLSVAVVGGRESARQRERERRTFHTDALTGLLNRQGVIERYLALPPGMPVTLVMVDLNDLKFINDSGGHGRGDEHITAVARALEGALPDQGFVGRWGGDEFVAVLPGSAPGGVEGFLRRAAAQAPRPRPSLSPFAAGMAEAAVGEPFERTLALADQRMYESKAQDREAELRETGERTTVGLETFSQRLELLDTPGEVLEVGLGLARDLLNFEGMTYYECQSGTFVPTHFKGVSQGEAELFEVGRWSDDRPGLVELAAATNSTIWSADYPSHPQALPGWVALGLKSVVLTPVRCRGQTLGVLGLIHFSTWRAITPQVRLLLEAVALRLGHTLERLHVIEEARASLEGGMLGLGLALEARDLETAGHTQRVVALAESLGKALGLGAPQLGDLRQGAYLHDIGKLAIPDAVLLKPARLDPDEWALMQTHAVRGVELAARIPALSAGALQVIRHHHERWDGLGYPSGLAGLEIPLLARIFAVCDVYDALTSERPYKPAWSPEAALAEIESQAGQHFDPRIVQALLSFQRPGAVLGGERGMEGPAPGTPEGAGGP